MMVTRIQAQILTKEAFAPFGEVIECKDAITYECNQGRAIRFHDLLKDIDILDQSGRLGVSIYRSIPSPMPFDVEVMERHPLGTQAFIPMTMDQQSRYLVAVAPAGELNPALITAFIVNGQVGINYKKGIWHLPIVALSKDLDFLAIDRIGQEKNCDEVKFPFGDLQII
jgi:ureidoglycolate lyase